MPIRGRWAFLPLLFFILPHSASADFFIHRLEDLSEESGIWRVRLDGAYYVSTTNFDGSGTLSSASGLRQYQRNQDDLTVSVGIAEPLSLFGRLSWALISQSGSSGDSSGNGLADQTIGLNLRLFRLFGGDNLKPRVTHFRFQFQWDLPAYASSSMGNLPILGDASHDLTASLLIDSPLHAPDRSGINALVGGGYTFRSNGFSSAIPWYLIFRYTPVQEGLLAELGVSGIFSLRTDSNLRSSTGSAGSYITGALNPSLTQAYASLGYRADLTWDIYLKGMYSLWGENAPRGLNVAVSFQKRFGVQAPPKKPTSLNQTGFQYGKANQGFVSYSMDATVLKSNDRLNLVKIDKGSQDGVEVGQIFDIFILKKDGSGGEAIARGETKYVKSDEAALEITEYYKEVWIDEGFVAKRVIK